MLRWNRKPVQKDLSEKKQKKESVPRLKIPIILDIYLKNIRFYYTTHIIKYLSVLMSIHIT